MYYKPDTQETFQTHSEIRDALPNVLFPPGISDEDLEYVGVFPLVYEKPEVPAGRIAEPIGVEQVDGRWTQGWNVRDMTQEEMDAAEAVKKAQVPQQVTLGQAREAIYNAGLLQQVDAAIAAIPDSDSRWRMQNAWEHRPTVERDSPFVASMAAALGLSAEETDQLFIAAATL